MNIILSNNESKLKTMFNIKKRLIVMNFLQFFVWGSWLFLLEAYWFRPYQNCIPYMKLRMQFWTIRSWSTFFNHGHCFSFYAGNNGHYCRQMDQCGKVIGICHLVGAGLLFLGVQWENPSTMFWVLLINLMFYMPTISLSIAVSYKH